MDGDEPKQIGPIDIKQHSYYAQEMRSIEYG